MKIAITGAGGQLGRDLIRVLGPVHELLPYTRQQLDVRDEEAVVRLIGETQPDVVIHAAAYTQVDQAEGQPEDAYMINSYGTRNVALAAQKAGAKMVYISTDYVFDGTKEGLYSESDRTNPLSIYGKSKLHGEKFVEIACERFYIVRTSWLYGKQGHNFVKKVLELAGKQPSLTMVSDQYGSPTYTYDLALFVAELICTDQFGVYHASNRGSCSRYEFAQEILRAAEINGVTLKPVSSAAFSLPAARPDNSAFDDTAIRNSGLTRIRDWKSALHDFICNDLER